ncbi:hypothetical protein K461DRAFT_324991 [Myriangium duriaei CBS 260.36]|uniref:Uncharacterized protein n=1 Tax=Myriangium duriaei CBS 260.36 TaxID=1168546 RepID=A0A9P4IT48_9PEZI|nr:hypothetical protein K461DRAFT_324991 [Myriangium duriaei CBS 260.36]
MSDYTPSDSESNSFLSDDYFAIDPTPPRPESSDKPDDMQASVKALKNMVGTTSADLTAFRQAIKDHADSRNTTPSGSAKGETLVQDVRHPNHTTKSAKTYEVINELCDTVENQASANTAKLMQSATGCKQSKPDAEQVPLHILVTDPDEDPVQASARRQATIQALREINSFREDDPTVSPNIKEIFDSAWRAHGLKPIDVNDPQPRSASIREMQDHSYYRVSRINPMIGNEAVADHFGIDQSAGTTGDSCVDDALLNIPASLPAASAWEYAPDDIYSEMSFNTGLKKKKKTTQKMAAGSGPEQRSVPALTVDEPYFMSGVLPELPNVDFAATNTDAEVSQSEKPDSTSIDNPATPRTIKPRIASDAVSKLVANESKSSAGTRKIRWREGDNEYTMSVPFGLPHSELVEQIELLKSDSALASNNAKGLLPQPLPVDNASKPKTTKRTMSQSKGKFTPMIMDWKDLRMPWQEENGVVTSSPTFEGQKRAKLRPTVSASASADPKANKSEVAEAREARQPASKQTGQMMTEGVSKTSDPIQVSADNGLHVKPTPPSTRLSHDTNPLASTVKSKSDIAASAPTVTSSITTKCDGKEGRSDRPEAKAKMEASPFQNDKIPRVQPQVMDSMLSAHPARGQCPSSSTPPPPDCPVHGQFMADEYRYKRHPLQTWGVPGDIFPDLDLISIRVLNRLVCLLPSEARDFLLKYAATIRAGRGDTLLRGDGPLSKFDKTRFPPAVMRPVAEVGNDHRDVLDFGLKPRMDGQRRFPHRLKRSSDKLVDDYRHYLDNVNEPGLVSPVWRADTKWGLFDGPSAQIKRPRYLDNYWDRQTVDDHYFNAGRHSQECYEKHCRLPNDMRNAFPANGGPNSNHSKLQPQDILRTASYDIPADTAHLHDCHPPPHTGAPGINHRRVSHHPSSTYNRDYGSRPGPNANRDSFFDFDACNAGRIYQISSGVHASHCPHLPSIDYFHHDLSRRDQCWNLHINNEVRDMIYACEDRIKAVAHNSSARHANALLRSPSDILVPFRKADNTAILAFPRTVKELNNLTRTATYELCWALDIHDTIDVVKGAEVWKEAIKREMGVWGMGKGVAKGGKVGIAALAGIKPEERQSYADVIRGLCLESNTTLETMMVYSNLHLKLRELVLFNVSVPMYSIKRLLGPSLEIFEMHFKERPMYHLLPVLQRNCPNLREFVLYDDDVSMGTSSTGLNFLSLKFFQSFKKLTHIYLGPTGKRQLPWKVMKQLLGRSGLNDLEDLKLYRYKLRVTDDNGALGKLSGPFPHVKAFGLEANSNAITTTVRKMPGLEDLSLNIIDPWLSFMPAMADLHALTRLTLWISVDTSIRFRDLRSLHRLENLTTLTMMVEPGVRAVLGRTTAFGERLFFSGFPNLVHIDLRLWGNLGDATLLALARKSPKLHTVHLPGAYHLTKFNDYKAPMFPNLQYFAMNDFLPQSWAQKNRRGHNEGANLLARHAPRLISLRSMREAGVNSYTEGICRRWDELRARPRSLRRRSVDLLKSGYSVITTLTLPAWIGS